MPRAVLVALRPLQPPLSTAHSVLEVVRLVPSAEGRARRLLCLPHVTSPRQGTGSSVSTQGQSSCCVRAAKRIAGTLRPFHARSLPQQAPRAVGGPQRRLALARPEPLLPGLGRAPLPLPRPCLEERLDVGKQPGLD